MAERELKTTNAIGLSSEREANLRKLAAYLRSGELKSHFDMLDVAETDDEYSVDCGSVGCAIGHGPYAGVPKMSGETWRQYQERVFGLESGIWSDPWAWCFSSSWIWVDNTPQGAAARIEWLLDKGLPENAEQQMYYGAPLCYQQ